MVKAMGGFGTARKVYTPRKASEGINLKASKIRHKSSISASEGITHQDTVQNITGLSPAIARPIRYIAGRLICARNIGSALAENGIKGTGSALAHSYDLWGARTSTPIPGRTVAVTDRKGGGHVALVSRVEGSRLWVWNPGRRGWSEMEYTNRRARYRVAG